MYLNLFNIRSEIWRGQFVSKSYLLGNCRPENEFRMQKSLVWCTQSKANTVLISGDHGNHSDQENIFFWHLQGLITTGGYETIKSHDLLILEGMGRWLI